jgi:hypothetical protein
MNNKIEFCRIRDNLKGIELLGTDANNNLIAFIAM